MYMYTCSTKRTQYTTVQDYKSDTVVYWIDVVTHHLGYEVHSKVLS